MKPLNDEQKEKVYDDLVKSLVYIHQPAPGEFTVETLDEVLKDGGYEISKSKIRHRLYKLVDAEILGKREITTHGARTNVYFPLREIPYDEIVEILLDG